MKISLIIHDLGGTHSAYDLSHGNTLPLIAVPWGFNSYAPQSNSDGNGWWFYDEDRRYFGLRVTHQPSPWINDYGQFLIKASMPSELNYINSNDFSGYDPNTSIFTPYYFKTTLIAYGTTEGWETIEFTPSNHGGIMRINFPPLDSNAADAGFLQTRRISVNLNGNSDSSLVSNTLISDVYTISGKVTKNSGGLSVSDTFGHYFVIAIYHGPDGTIPATSPIDMTYDSTAARIDFSSTDELNEVFTLRFATSFISLEQAIINLQYEVDIDKSFEDVMSLCKVEWNNVLSHITVDEISSDYNSNEKDDLLTTFYSSMYRASLFPRQLIEYDINGENGIHYSPYDGQIHNGTLSTDR